MIKSLEDISLDLIYDAFIDAFSNYEAKMELTIDQLKAMLFTRSYNSKYSRGYFEDDILVGFLLVGYREIQGEKWFYDTATGIRKDYQKKGIGNALLEEVINEMGREGIDRFVLEVLENNVPAQELYRKHGFQIVRRLCCFEYNLVDLSGATIYREQLNNKTDNESIDYCSFAPTWQNSNTSFNNCRDEYNKIDFFKDAKKIGYVIINLKNGSILQFGVRREHRNNEYIEGILLNLKIKFGIEKIRLLNIEDKSEMYNLLKEFGMNNFINQYEMELKVNRT